MSEGKIIEFPSANNGRLELEPSDTDDLPGVSDALFKAVHLLHDRDLALNANKFGATVPKRLLDVTIEDVY